MLGKADTRLESTTKHPLVSFYHCQMGQIDLVRRAVALKQRGATALTAPSTRHSALQLETTGHKLEHAERK